MDQQTQNVITSERRPSGMPWANRKAKFRRDFDAETFITLRGAAKVAFDIDVPTTVTDNTALVTWLCGQVKSMHAERDDRQSALELLMKGRDEANVALQRALEEIDPPKSNGKGEMVKRFTGPVFFATAAALRALRIEAVEATADKIRVMSALSKQGLVVRDGDVIGMSTLRDVIAGEIRAGVLVEIARQECDTLTKLLWEEAMPAMNWLAANTGFNLGLIGRTRGDFTHALRRIRDLLELKIKAIHKGLEDGRNKAAFELGGVKKERDGAEARAESLEQELETVKREAVGWKQAALGAEQHPFRNLWNRVLDKLCNDDTESTGPA